MVHGKIVGTGSFLPNNIVSNDELAKTVDTSHEWIVTRTGICQRHIADETEYTSDMGAKAAKKALEAASISAKQLDMIIVATTTPDRVFPSTAAKIQAILNASMCPAFDVQAVCSGFIYALSLANNVIQAGQAKNILVVGTEKMSEIVDWNDRGTCVLFGDGASAVVLSATENLNEGMMASTLYADGNYDQILYVNGGVCIEGDGYLKMVGKEVFKHAVEKMASCVDDLLQRASLSRQDIDWLIPHQANLRIIKGVGKKLGLSDSKVVITVDKHANTSAASVGLALDSLVQSGKLKRGDRVVLEALGGGLTWGGCLLQWS